MRLIRLLKKDLARETGEWVDEGIISLQQAEQICRRYGIDFHKASDSTLGYSILIGLGYLFIGLSVITLLSANWEDIPRELRMSGLIVLTLAVQLLALKMHSLGRESRATGLSFLGCLFYGASIMLIAQIYHIDEHYPDGILWWAIGVVPFAVFMQSTLLTLLAVALAFIWFFVESSLGYFPTVFLLFMGLAAWHVFRVKQSMVLFLALMVGLAFWSEYLLAWHMRDNYRMDFGAEHVGVGISIAFLYAGLADWLGSRQDREFVDYGAILGVWILRFAVITLLVFSFEEPWRQLLNAEWDLPVLTVVTVIVLPVLALVLTHHSGRRLAPRAFLVTYFIAAQLAAVYVNYSGSDYQSIYFQVCENIVLVVSGIWLLIRGIRDGMTQYFYLGILTILAAGLLRYIDLVGDYVGAAILFMIFAFLLLATARYWKRYRGGKPEDRAHE